MTWSTSSKPEKLRSQVVQLMRFCAVGLACYAASITSFTALCELAHVPYTYSFVLSFVIGNLLGFWLNGRFTYTAQKKVGGGSLARYITINLMFLGLGFVALRFLVESLHVWYVAANFMVAAASAPLSFLMHRAISYRARGAPQATEGARQDEESSRPLAP